MNDMTPTSAERAEKLEGMGCKRKRVEDIRFTQGKGNYVDDLKLPGMLYGDFNRSPHAHARIKKIDTTKAAAVPGVVAVITAETLKTVNLAWMPTLAGDTQMVLADGKVLFQNQEVAFVIAEDRYIAADAADLVEVEYEPLPVNVDPLKAMASGRAGDPRGPQGQDRRRPRQAQALQSHLLLAGRRQSRGRRGVRKSRGDDQGNDRLSARASLPARDLPMRRLVRQDQGRADVVGHVPGAARHPHGRLADLENPRAQDPRHRPRHRRRLRQQGRRLSGLYLLDRGVDRDRTPGKMGRGPHRKPVDHGVRARLLHGRGNRRDQGRQGHGLRCYTIADHGAFDACANATKWPAGLFSIISGSYDFPAAHCLVDGVYTNKAPGGVAYRCSFRVTEAAYAIERAMDIMAQKLGMDPAEFRMKNLIRREQFPYTSAFGWQYDSGDYQTAMNKAMEAVDYKKLRDEQKAKREAFKRGETRDLMGIGVAFFTEIVGAGPSRACDILGIAMFDSAEIRIHPTGSGICRLGTKSQGQGHETTYAQIIATELGLPADSIMVEEGNTDTAPYGLGTYGSRSTPVSGAATAMACRKIKAKAQMIAAYMLEVHDDDLEWDVDRFRVKGNPERFKTMTELAWAAYHEVPPGMEPGLEAINYYDPPNFTFPFGAYICVVDVDVDTGTTKVRRFYALDDCGTRINPMIIEGQIHGGLTEAFAIAMGQEIHYDEDGNVTTASFMDYFLPTAVETPHWETDWTTTPSPHHPIGAKGVGESPNVGGVPCFSNAINDAFAFLGSTHIQMPHDHWRTWAAAEKLGLHG